MHCLKLKAADARPWVARITGRHPKFRFARKFVEGRRTLSTICFYLPDENAAYEVCEHGERRYIATRKGDAEMHEIFAADVALIIEGTSTDEIVGKAGYHSEFLCEEQDPTTVDLGGEL